MKWASARPSRPSRSSCPVEEVELGRLGRGRRMTRGPFGPGDGDGKGAPQGLLLGHAGGPEGLLQALLRFSTSAWPTWHGQRCSLLGISLKRRRRRRRRMGMRMARIGAAHGRLASAAQRAPRAGLAPWRPGALQRAALEDPYLVGEAAAAAARRRIRDLGWLAIQGLLIFLISLSLCYKSPYLVPHGNPANLPTTDSGA